MGRLRPGAGPARIRNVLAALEREYGTDYEIDELIAASFVEDLSERGEPGSGILGLLGPKLGKELNRQGSQDVLERGAGANAAHRDPGGTGQDTTRTRLESDHDAPTRKARP